MANEPRELLLATTHSWPRALRRPGKSPDSHQFFLYTCCNTLSEVINQTYFNGRGQECKYHGGPAKQTGILHVGKQLLSSYTWVGANFPK
jgi:hypothetical protein